ncbi:hypothetical protein D5018_09240 [Parashewanella curva]|uniref:Uncharacterized protein n=1 Tax=Parashewanella curva TaxID=2338552 RepID=A0A3L8PZL6_9GAMM|nr:hypothetical protein [Parashewanella curva]RLV59978.1 hypothetical protein D5018_09240 [Parashewanella curva]
MTTSATSTSRLPPISPDVLPIPNEKTYRVSMIFPFIKGNLNQVFFQLLGIEFSQYKSWQSQYKRNSVYVGAKALTAAINSGKNIGDITNALDSAGNNRESAALRLAFQNDPDQFYLETSNSYLNPTNSSSTQAQTINHDLVFQHFKPERDSWFKLGLYLDIDVNELFTYDDEERGNCEHCLQRVLKRACQAHAQLSDLHQAMDKFSNLTASNFLKAFQGNEQKFYLTEPSSTEIRSATGITASDTFIQKLITENQTLKQSVTDHTNAIARHTEMLEKLNQQVSLLMQKIQSHERSFARAAKYAEDKLGKS